MENPARDAGGGTPNGAGRLRPNDVRRVQPFLASLHLELHDLALGEGLESVHLDGGEVHEHVLAAFLLNEAVALGVIEPLHFSLSHSVCLLNSHAWGTEHPARHVSGAIEMTHRGKVVKKPRRDADQGP